MVGLEFGRNAEEKSSLEETEESVSLIAIALGLG